jgi:hypothetical protein
MATRWIVHGPYPRVSVFPTEENKHKRKNIGKNMDKLTNKSVYLFLERVNKVLLKAADYKTDKPVHSNDVLLRLGKFAKDEKLSIRTPDDKRFVVYSFQYFQEHTCWDLTDQLFDEAFGKTNEHEFDGWTTTGEFLRDLNEFHVVLYDAKMNLGCDVSIKLHSAHPEWEKETRSTWVVEWFQWVVERNGRLQAIDDGKDGILFDAETTDSGCTIGRYYWFPWLCSYACENDSLFKKACQYRLWEFEI